MVIIERWHKEGINKNGSRLKKLLKTKKFMNPSDLEREAEKEFLKLFKPKLKKRVLDFISRKNDLLSPYFTREEILQILSENSLTSDIRDVAPILEHTFLGKLDGIYGNFWYFEELYNTDGKTVYKLKHYDHDYEATC